MKKKIIIISSIVVALIIIIIGSIIIYNKWRVENAEIIVKLEKNLDIEVYSDIRLKDLIKSVNGKITKNFKIDTTKLGEQTIDFEFINNDNIKVSYSFKINIVDKTPPVIAGIKNLTIKKGYTGNIEKELFCGDNYDDTPKCEIIGEYDVNVPGSYNLTFKGTDSSNNTEENNFTLRITEKTTSSSTKTETVSYEEIVKKYKTENTKIGIDVSHWQGDIDFEKVKEAGVEFVFIRVGTQQGINDEYILDKKFEQNIKGFQEVEIPIGIYYYSYANNKKSAKKEAEWVLSQIKDYNIELPVVYDWENWSFYQEFNKSFYNLTEMANTFLSVVEKANYEGMLYSSKSYLENVWYETKYDTWLAHYTENTTYEGNYKVWQLCNNGIVPGIDDNMVDINVMYN